MYHLLGLSLALAALLTLNALVALAVAALWRGWLDARTRCWPASARAQLLFALRVAPFAFALVVVGALVLPAYWLYEPAASAEVVSAKLAALAALATTGLALAAWRGLAAWRATHRLTARWLSHAEPIKIAGLEVPAYSVAHRFPVVAIVGAFRPRLFIARQLLTELTADELRAALAHEAGHLAARDNLKRAVLRACRDALTIVPVGRALDRAWGESAEAAADEHAARVGDADAALDLAAALIKIARLAPPGARPLLPAAAFLIGELDGGTVAWRVRRLTQLAAGDAARARARLHPAWVWAGGAALLLVAALVGAFDARVLAGTHTALEYVVSALR